LDNMLTFVMGYGAREAERPRAGLDTLLSPLAPRSKIFP
jgi:hypothetical protein